MATNTPSLESVITVKVNYQGTTRRAKMPLSDTMPHLLEEQLRIFLHIPKDTGIILERYSDSAGAYVLLEPSNSTVYKQLYRAAKAKSKLKLRVSHKPTQDAQVPKPVTVEDVLENPHAPSPNDCSSADTLCTNTKPLVPTPAPHRDSSATPSNSSAQPGHPNSPGQRPPTMPRVASQASKPSASSEQPQINAEQRYKQVLDRFLPPQCPRFAICCNSCEKTTPDVHYHCSTCDDGDFDLCQDCVDKGVSCYGTDHWLIKRTNVAGQIVNSTTEKIAPKPKAPKAPRATQTEMSERQSWVPNLGPPEGMLVDQLQKTLDLLDINARAQDGRVGMRTCNQCVQELTEAEFLHCKDCEDYDLCRECFSKDSHGHHPHHAFEPAVVGTEFSAQIRARLAPGRNKMHHAICDKCDKFITGVRHKCLECPDWDYCTECAPGAATTHPGHRFVPIYEPLKAGAAALCSSSHNVHTGICCDGPLCFSSKGYPTYIRGVRYKCAVCHDVDFCASCEASPANQHNKTHPLIKFSTPVRHVSVTTHGEHADGQQMPAMGDQAQSHALPVPSHTGTVLEASSAPRSAPKLDIHKPQTVFDTEPEKSLYSVYKKGCEYPSSATNVCDNAVKVGRRDLMATFLHDDIRDGTIMNPDATFSQTWMLRNDGRTSWPVGSNVRFVGGDYMGRPSSRNPAATSSLAVASVTNSTTEIVAPGECYPFTVQLRAPPRPGRGLSFWRLTTPEGDRFGHRLWCDIRVRQPAPAVFTTPKTEPVTQPEAQDQVSEEKNLGYSETAAKTAPKTEVEKVEEDVAVSETEPEEASTQSSQMIFPKLEKESPEASIHQTPPEATHTQPEDRSIAGEDFEECSKETDWDGSDDDFLTDEEYDILDASDEDFVEEHKKTTTS